VCNAVFVPVLQCVMQVVLLVHVTVSSNYHHLVYIAGRITVCVAALQCVLQYMLQCMLQYVAHLPISSHDHHLVIFRLVKFHRPLIAANSLISIFTCALQVVGGLEPLI